MAAEIHVLVAALDFRFVIAYMLDKTLGMRPKVESPVDSKTLFYVVVRDAKTAERCLHIDMLAVKESCRRENFSKLEWIPVKSNLVDALMKEALKIKILLWNLISLKQLKHTSLGRAITIHTQTRENTHTSKASYTCGDAIRGKKTSMRQPQGIQKEPVFDKGHLFAQEKLRKITAMCRTTT